MDQYRETPIFIKSQEIFETLRTITDLIPEENEHLEFTK